MGYITDDVNIVHVILIKMYAISEILSKQDLRYNWHRKMYAGIQSEDY